MLCTSKLHTKTATLVTACKQALLSNNNQLQRFLHNNSDYIKQLPNDKDHFAATLTSPNVHFCRYLEQGMNFSIEYWRHICLGEVETRYDSLLLGACITRKLNSTAASSAGRLRRDNVTLTFDLLTPNLISSSLTQDVPMTTVWWKSMNGYWRYHGNM